MTTRDQVAARAGRAARSGFTLVELLVVIMIIAMLAALVTPAVMRAQASARNAQIKAEIDMLHIAVMNYRNEYGAFPPCLSAAGGGTPAARHLAKLFPKCTVIATQVTGAVTPANALLGWLSGYTEEPTRPVVGEDLNGNNTLDLGLGEDINNNLVLDTFARKRLFDYDTSRTDTSGLMYFPPSRRGSPYIYINSSYYTALDVVSGTTSLGWPSAATPYTVSTETFSIAPSTYYPIHIPTSASAADWTNIARPYFNADSFQILNAGRDETFGTDDDLSNFWPGTRKDYLDSLK